MSNSGVEQMISGDLFRTVEVSETKKRLFKKLDEVLKIKYSYNKEEEYYFIKDNILLNKDCDEFDCENVKYLLEFKIVVSVSDFEKYKVVSEYEIFYNYWITVTHINEEGKIEYLFFQIHKYVKNSNTYLRYKFYKKIKDSFLNEHFIESDERIRELFQ